MRRSSGFTLVEMVVVLAVVAILAAILTPTIAKNIRDAKIARATNEAQVIGAAVGSFYKDLGRWPTGNGVTTADTIQLLFGPGDTPAIQGGGVAQEQFWLNDGTGWGAALLDTFENQLITNTPAGGTAYPDDSTSPRPELRWQGPYLTEVKPDPWGAHYSCNIFYTYTQVGGAQQAVSVWCAGADRTSNTDCIQAATAFTVGGDDIVFRLQ